MDISARFRGPAKPSTVSARRPTLAPCNRSTRGLRKEVRGTLTGRCSSEERRTLLDCFRWDRCIVECMNQEHWRRIYGHLQFIGIEFDQSGRRILAQKIRLCSPVSPVTQRHDRVDQNRKIRTAAYTINRALASASPLSNCVPAVEARCPPAEKPMMPIFAESRCQSFAFARTVRMARSASSTIPVMPC